MILAGLAKYFSKIIYNDCFGELSWEDMRLDKWLKVSRLIKRRTVAQMACEQGRVYVNEKPAKSAYTLKEDDVIHIELGARALTIKVLTVPLKTTPARMASSLYEVIEEIRRPPEVLEWLPEDEMW